MIDEHADTTWDRDLDDLFLRIGQRFARADLLHPHNAGLESI